jgi:hypothetical protein
LRTFLNKQKDKRAKKSYVKKSVAGPNNPIPYPIGIESTPSPSEAHIIKLAVFCFDS